MTSRKLITCLFAAILMRSPLLLKMRHISLVLFKLGARARAQNAAMFRLLVPKMYVCSHSINRARALCIQTAGIATCMHFVFDIAV